MARTAFLSRVGRAALQVGGILMKCSLMHATMKTTMTEDERERKISLGMKGVFATCEAAYRKRLLDAGAMSASEMPAPAHPVPGSQPTAELPPPADVFTVGALVDDDVDPTFNPDALSQDAVFRRLEISGVGGQVRIRPGCTLMPVGDHAASHTSPLTVMTGTLVELDMPRGKIEIKGADAKSLPAVYQVHVDSLLPCRDTGPQPTREPALADENSATCVLPAFDIERIGGSAMRNMAVGALDWLLMATAAQVMNLKILLLSEEGALPYEFQVRVNKPFKAGELVLAPWVTGSQPTALVPAHTDGPQAPSSAKVVHPTLRASAEICVRGLSKLGTDPKAKTKAKAKPKPTEGDAPGEQPLPEEKFLARSPLLRGKAKPGSEPVYTNMAPFWAVPRCSKSSPEDNNMEVQMVALDLPQLVDVAGLSTSLSKRSRPSFRALVQVMVNTMNLKAGAMLALPFHGD